jgi:hypothetical protein
MSTETKTQKMKPYLPSTGEIHRLMSNSKLRLEEEYGWEKEFVNGAVNEFIRFLELHIYYPNVTIVPGKVVDKVWHDFILHTKLYINFCETYFGEYMHHDPKDRTSNAVMDMKPTIDLYEQHFGHEAPFDFWLADVVVKLPAHPSLSSTTIQTESGEKEKSVPKVIAKEDDMSLSPRDRNPLLRKVKLAGGGSYYTGGCCRCH